MGWRLNTPKPNFGKVESFRASGLTRRLGVLPDGQRKGLKPGLLRESGLSAVASRPPTHRVDLDQCVLAAGCQKLLVRNPRGINFRIRRNNMILRDAAICPIRESCGEVI